MTSEGFTVMIWAKWDIEPGLPNPVPSELLDRRWATIAIDGTTDNNAQFQIQHNQFNTLFEVAMRTQGEGAQRRWRLSTTPPEEGVWCHLAGVFDKDASRLRFYVNGVQEADISLSGEEIRDSPDYLQFGSEDGIDFGSTTGLRKFHGQTTGFQRFYECLSPEEILSIYEEGHEEEGEEEEDLVAGISFAATEETKTNSEVGTGILFGVGEENQIESGINSGLSLNPQTGSKVKTGTKTGFSLGATEESEIHEWVEPVSIPWRKESPYVSDIPLESQQPIQKEPYANLGLPANFLEEERREGAAQYPTDFLRGYLEEDLEEEGAKVIRDIISTKFTLSTEWVKSCSGGVCVYSSNPITAKPFTLSQKGVAEGSTIEASLGVKNPALLDKVYTMPIMPESDILMVLANVSGTPVVGNTITGQTSGATGVIREVNEIEPNHWEIGIVEVVGAFSPGEAIVNPTTMMATVQAFYFTSEYLFEKVVIGRSIDDAFWTCDATIDSPIVLAPFKHFSVRYPDKNNITQVLFYGFIPNKEMIYKTTHHQTVFTGYDTAWYLSKQLRSPDDTYFPKTHWGNPGNIINLLLGMNDWRTETGINPYKIGTADYTIAPQKDWQFRFGASKLDNIKEISEYHHMVFYTHWRVGQNFIEPAAYFSREDHIDWWMDLPPLATFNNPSEDLIGQIAIEEYSEERYNYVEVFSPSPTGTGAWFHGLKQSPEVEAGTEIPIQYIETRPDFGGDPQLCQARAEELYAYYSQPTYIYTMKLINRVDLRLYQQVQFWGFTGVSQLPMRIIGITYTILPTHAEVEIRVTPSARLSDLRRIMRGRSADPITEIKMVADKEIEEKVGVPEIGEVEEIVEPGIAKVRLERGSFVLARFHEG